MTLMTACKTFDKEYDALFTEEIAVLKHQAEEAEHAKTYVPKQVKWAQQLDVSKVANSIQQAVSAKHLQSLLHCTKIFKLDALHCCTGHYGICILVHGDCSMNTSPIVAKTGEISQFFEDTTNKPFLQLLEELDACCIKGLKGIYFLHTIECI